MTFLKLTVYSKTICSPMKRLDFFDFYEKSISK